MQEGSEIGSLFLPWCLGYMTNSFLLRSRPVCISSA